MKKVKLGEVATEVKENSKEDKTGCRIVGLEHLTPSCVTLNEWGENEENTFTKRFRKGDVLFGRRRAYLKKAAMAPFDGICSGDITVIRAIPGKIDSMLLPFVIQNDKFFDFAVGKSAGSLSPRVKWEHLKQFEFCLLDMEEQHKLADVLWAIHETKEAYRRLIERTDELVKSQFIEMFGDPIFNEKGWNQKPLCEVLADGCVVTYGIVKTEDNIPGGIPVFRPVDISQGHIPTRGELKCTSRKISDQYRRTLLKGDELLITVRGSIGETFQTSSEFAGCNVARNIVPLRANQRLLSQDFLKDILDSVGFQRKLGELTKGVALKGINMNEFKVCPIILPPLQKQNEFVRFRQQANKSKLELKQSIESADNLMKAILIDNLESKEG